MDSIGDRLTTDDYEALEECKSDEIYDDIVAVILRSSCQDGYSKDAHDMPAIAPMGLKNTGFTTSCDDGIDHSEPLSKIESTEADGADSSTCSVENLLSTYEELGIKSENDGIGVLKHAFETQLKKVFLNLNNTEKDMTAKRILNIANSLIDPDSERKFKFAITTLVSLLKTYPPIINHVEDTLNRVVNISFNPNFQEMRELYWIIQRNDQRSCCKLDSWIIGFRAKETSSYTRDRVLNLFSMVEGVRSPTPSSTGFNGLSRGASTIGTIDPPLKMYGGNGIKEHSASGTIHPPMKPIAVGVSAPKASMPNQRQNPVNNLYRVADLRYGKCIAEFTKYAQSLIGSSDIPIDVKKKEILDLKKTATDLCAEHLVKLFEIDNKMSTIFDSLLLDIDNKKNTSSIVSNKHLSRKRNERTSTEVPQNPRPLKKPNH